MQKPLSVVIGRFQTPTLTLGHHELIKTALNLGEKTLILVGTTAAEGTDKNPLSFHLRKHLFSEYSVEVLPLPDIPLSNKDWSDLVDSIITQAGFEQATIFGGRDNSIENYYNGKHSINIIDTVESRTGTDSRSEVVVRDSEDFRAGVIYQCLKRYPIVYPTVDVAIVKIVDTSTEDLTGVFKTYILMGKKGDAYTFVGGFVDKQDPDYESAAKREVQEETGWDLKDSTFNYVFSYRVEDDLRYAKTKDSIMTMFFEVYVDEDIGLPDPTKISDKEFKEFSWVEASKDSLPLISPVHIGLFKRYIEDYDDTE